MMSSWSTVARRKRNTTIRFSIEDLFEQTPHESEMTSRLSIHRLYGVLGPISFDDELIDAILFFIAASQWDKTQFFKIIDWLFNKCLNTYSINRMIPDSSRGKNFKFNEQEIELSISTLVRIGLFAQTFEDHDDGDDNKNENNDNDSKNNYQQKSDSKNYNYNNYFKDLTKVKYILKSMVDSNIKQDESRIQFDYKNTNINANNPDQSQRHKMFVISTPFLHRVYYSVKRHRNNIRDAAYSVIFWQLYKDFVLTLLFGNFKKPHMMSDNDHNERNHIIGLLEKCLRIKDKNIVNSHCIKYNYDYIEDFIQCLWYLRKLFMQSMDIGSQAHNGYYEVMNWDFRNGESSVLEDDYINSWASQLIDVICFTFEDTDFPRRV